MAQVSFKCKGERTRYSFVDKRCIGRPCWAPGMFQHRSPLAGGGSMNTSSPDSPCCMNRAYRGCPKGPEGACELECSECGNDPTKRADCVYCAGYGRLTIIGLPVFQADLAAKRKADGWKWEQK